MRERAVAEGDELSLNRIGDWSPEDRFGDGVDEDGDGFELRTSGVSKDEDAAEDEP